MKTKMVIIGVRRSRPFPDRLDIAGDYCYCQVLKEKPKKVESGSYLYQGDWDTFVEVPEDRLNRWILNEWH